MSLDREDTLKKAEKLLRQGRLDAAIAEYLRVVEDQPRDWATANTLGDLYVRAGQAEKAVAQYSRIADHFVEDGFYPKSAALYKKILKIAPGDEPTQMKLAELSVLQGLLADARAHFNALASKRRGRGDQRGADDITLRLGELDPGDFDARRAAAHVLAARGEGPAAAAIYRAIHDDLIEKGRSDEALAALREAVRLDPADLGGRASLAKDAIARGAIDEAHALLDRATAGSDPALLLPLAEMELRLGQIESAGEILRQLRAGEAGLRQKLVDLAWVLAEGHPDAAFACVDCAVDGAVSAKAFDEAVTLLKEFAARVPEQIPPLLKLVEVCVDGGLEMMMFDAQVQLADAYLASGQAAEARVIAEDLVAREPWESAHIERFRRALVMLRVPEPDSVIAERLSGQSPFTATDPFAEPLPPAVEPPPADPVPEPVAAPAEQATAALVEPSRAPVPGPHPDGGAADSEIDLSSALGELDAPHAAAAGETSGLDEAFKDFRSAVSRQSGADQSGQHMKLAETYLEMGMLDEAMFSLKTASRSARYRFEASALLGRMYKEQNDLPHALEWLERAAESPAPGPEQGRGLMYELGTALEMSGETARALAVFLEIQAEAGDYRDVPARIERLARVQAGG